MTKPSEARLQLRRKLDGHESIPHSLHSALQEGPGYEPLLVMSLFIAYVPLLTVGYERNLVTTQLQGFSWWKPHSGPFRRIS